MSFVQELFDFLQLGLIHACLAVLSEKLLPSASATEVLFRILSVHVHGIAV